MRQNAHEVASMRADADARQLTYVLDTVITARNDGSDTSLATRIDDEQLRALYRGPLRDLVPDGAWEVSGELPLQLRPRKLRDYRHGRRDPVHFRALGGGQRPRAQVRRHLAFSPVFQHIRGLRMADYAACTPCPDKGYCVR